MGKRKKSKAVKQMTVAQLIASLKRLPPNMPVMICDQGGMYVPITTSAILHRRMSLGKVWPTNYLPDPLPWYSITRGPAGNVEKNAKGIDILCID